MPCASRTCSSAVAGGVWPRPPAAAPAALAAPPLRPCPHWRFSAIAFDRDVPGTRGRSARAVDEHDAANRQRFEGQALLAARRCRSQAAGLLDSAAGRAALTALCRSGALRCGVEGEVVCATSRKRDERGTGEGDVIRRGTWVASGNEGDYLSPRPGFSLDMLCCLCAVR